MGLSLGTFSAGCVGLHQAGYTGVKIPNKRHVSLLKHQRVCLLHKQMNCAQDHRNLDEKKEVKMVFYLLKISALGFSQKANTAPRRKEDSNLFHHFHYNTQPISILQKYKSRLCLLQEESLCNLNSLQICKQLWPTHTHMTKTAGPSVLYQPFYFISFRSYLKN